MSANSNRSVYIGNLDDRVSDRVLYNILIQAGRVVDLHIPRDKETDKPKGYAFAEYETDEIADYAVRLFSGLVTLYNRTLKFAISGQDKSPQNSSAAGLPAANSFNKPRHHSMLFEHSEISQYAERFSGSQLVSAHPSNYLQEPPPPGVSPPSNEQGSYLNVTNFEYSRRVLGSTVDSINRSRSRRYDTSNPASNHGY